MSSITKAFTSSKALIPFITCGDPTIDSTLNIVKAAVDNGADLMYLGIPFSDPTAEGQSIQEAHLRALKNQVTTDDVFDLAGKMRQEISVPLVLSTYANIVFSYGIEAFFKRCAKVGAQGVLIADVPYEEKDEFEELALEQGVELISVVAPTSGQRMSKIASSAHGFVYMMGTQDCDHNNDQYLADLKDMVQLLRLHTSLPCVVSVDTAHQASQVAQLCDGVVIGADILNIIAEHGQDAAPYVGRLVKEIKDAIQDL